jgi:hypothetical protein
VLRAGIGSFFVPANPPPSFPEYPFTEFVRDFEAVDRAVEDVRGADHAMSVRLAGSVARSRYPNVDDALRRGAALAMARAFLENHLDDRRFRRHARAAAGGSLYSEGLFEAVYLLVVGFALDPARPRPEPAAVVSLADRRERERRTRKTGSTWERVRRGLERLLRP